MSDQQYDSTTNIDCAYSNEAPKRPPESMNWKLQGTILERAYDARILSLDIFFRE